MMNRRIPVAVATLSALMLGLTACGSDDDSSSSDTTAAASESSDSTADSTTSDTTDTSESTDDTAGAGSTGTTEALPEGAPNATLPANLPVALAPAFRPMEIVGDALPIYGDEDPGSDPAVGTPAPVIIGYDIDDNPITVDASVDGPTMLMFMAHWCPHCNNELPVIKQMSDDGQLDDINTVAVMTASDPSAANWPPATWLKDNEWPFPAVFEGVVVSEVDGEEQLSYAAMSAFGGSGFPYTVLINGDGDVVARWSGALEAEEITKALDTYLR